MAIGIPAAVAIALALSSLAGLVAITPGAAVGLIVAGASVLACLARGGHAAWV